MSRGRAGSNGRAGWWAVALFAVSALPRVVQLGAFVTPDERRWLERSVDLLRALQTGDFALAYHEGNPAGIVTKWLGLAGIWVRYVLHQLGWHAHLDPTIASSSDLSGFVDAISAQPPNPMDVLPAARMPVALVTALMVAAIFLLARKLWGERAALAAALVVALDPFFLAHGRLLHQDALVSGFVVLSILALAVATRARSLSWCALALSGCLAGLAALTKPTALLLAPWAVGWLAWSLLRERRAGTWLAACLAWSAVLGAVYFVAWPSMWVAPAGTVMSVFSRTTELAAEGHNQFFFGQAVADPGPFFYPVVWLFRSTPLAWLGLAALVWLGARRDPSVRKAGWPALFVALFVLGISMSAKKNDRYLLPTFVVLDILAGLGLSYWLSRADGFARRIRPAAVAIGLVAVAQAGLAVWHHPYYLTYYNPLVAGPWLAPRVLLVGWGEGLDRAGAFLNGLNGAEKLSASSYYRREFSPFFKGTVRKLADDTPADFDLLAWHASDYIVSYVSQRQTGQPDPTTAAFLESLIPEHVVRLGGIDYAWVYRTPEQVPDALVPAEHILRRQFGPAILLLGYDDPVLQFESAPTLSLALYWQGVAPVDVDYRVCIRLLDAGGEVRAECEAEPYGDQYSTSLWPRGVVLRDVHDLPLPADLPSGQYSLAVSLVPLASGAGDVIIGPLHVNMENRTSTATGTALP